MAIHPDSDELITSLSAEFSVPEDVVRRMYDPRVIQKVAANTPVKVPIANYISAAIVTAIVILVLAPVVALLACISFSIAAHAWMWVSF